MARSLLALTLAVTSCAGGRSDAGASPGQRRLTAAARALCDARRQSRAGDVAGADRAFQDGVHGYLHDLAERLTTFDRAEAGELLVAKQRVEGALAADAAPADVADLLDGLASELEEGAGATGLEAPACEVAA